MRSIPELSVDAQVLERSLNKADVGATVTYEALSALIGRNVQTSARHLLQTATRRLERDGKVFAAVFGVGVKRLDDAGVIGTGEAAIRSIGRKATRSAKKLSTVEYDVLSEPLKLKHNAMISALGVLRHMSRSRTLDKLEIAVGQAAQALALGPCLEELKTQLGMTPPVTSL